MKKMLSISLIALLLLAGISAGDTFTYNAKNDTPQDSNQLPILHGFANGPKTNDGLSEIITVEKGPIKLNLNNYDIIRNKTGRNNTVSLFKIPNTIMYAMETRALEEALKTEAAKGPLFILIEIDSPGGRVDLAKRICSAINDIDNCDIYAYITGGTNGGAYSAAAAVSFACDKIFMSTDSVIGAATVIATNEEGVPVDLEEIYGKKIGEKFGSAWRNYLASLAENHNRPGILAKAMEDKDIEALEVIDNGNRAFIDATNKKPQQQIVKTWSKKGDLLTLTANEATECKMADQIYNSRSDLLQALGGGSSLIQEDSKMKKARQLCERIEKSIKNINASVDLGIKQLNSTRSRAQAMKAMRSMMRDAKFVLGLKKKFGDDVAIDEDKVRSFLNSVQAEFEALKIGRRH